MHPIPIKLREEMASDPYYKRCIRKNEGNCSGRITWDHTFEYCGKQIQEEWSIVPVCYYHHLGDGFEKTYNQYISVNRMSKKDEEKYPRKDWRKIRNALNAKYEKQLTKKLNK